MWVIPRNVKVRFKRFDGKRFCYFKKQDSYIFTKDEAEKQGINFIYWRDFLKPDSPDRTDYVLTDDGYVVELLNIHRKPYAHCPGYYNLIVRIVTQCMYADKPGKNKLTIEHKGVRFRGLNGAPERMPAAQKEFCRNMGMGMSAVQAYMMTYLNSRKGSAKQSAEKLLKRKHIREMIFMLGKEYEIAGFNRLNFIATLVSKAREDEYIAGLVALDMIGLYTGWDGSASECTKIIELFQECEFNKDEYIRLMIKKTKVKGITGVKALKKVGTTTGWDGNVQKKKMAEFKPVVLNLNMDVKQKAM